MILHTELAVDVREIPLHCGNRDEQLLSNFAIGAFLGWKAALFSLMFSSIIGAVVGLMLIVLRKREWSSRLPYGPYIAAAATLWMFAGPQLIDWWLRTMARLAQGG